MASIPALMLSRWRSRKHVGPAKPKLEVWVRRGRFDRGYKPWSGGDVHALIPFQATRPWQATWRPELTPNGEWRKVDGVLDATRQRDFDQNGMTQLTLTVENVRHKEMSGIAGIYHKIEKGYLSPFGGYKPPHRPGTGQAPTEWYELLASDAQIVVLQGYGDPMVATFTGLIDDVELDGNPARVVCSVRDFGKTLTDQNCFGWVKDKAMREPVVFADRDYADEKKRVGGAARASSTYKGYAPRFILDDEKLDTSWISNGHNGPDFTEWVEIEVPRGRYEDIYLHPRYHGMDAYVSVYAKDDNKGLFGGQPYWQDQRGVRHKLPTGWIDVGKGDVPGGNGGRPFLSRFTAQKGGRHYRLGRSYILGDGSKIRVHFRRLGKSSSTGKFHAGVRRLAAIRRTRKREAVKARWILVDDISDMVKVVLRWAGFKEWDIEDTGVRLVKKLVFNRGDKLIDIIKKAEEITHYVFFVNDPASNPIGNDASLGIPTFRESRVIKNSQPGGTLEIRDTDLLTAIKAKFTDEPLAFPIRVRGAQVKAKVRDFGVGLTNEDRARRWQSFYHPPWALRIAYLIKHVVHYEPFYTSQAEVDLAARFIALAEALQSATAMAETPGLPSLELDKQVLLRDTATGLATRLYIASHTSTHTTGEQGSWKDTITGALIDVPDVVKVVHDIDTYDVDQDDKSPRATGTTWSGSGRI